MIDRSTEYALKDGLFAAGMFNVLHRLCRSVTMANLSQLVNVMGAIHTTENGILLTPTYDAFDLYVNHSGDVSLDTLVESETFETESMEYPPSILKLKSVPYVDASATLSRKKRKLYLAVVNRHMDQSIECPVALEGFVPTGEAKVFELNGPDVMARNEIGRPNRVVIEEKTTGHIGRKFTYSFPAHSATVIEIDL